MDNESDWILFSRVQEPSRKPSPAHQRNHQPLTIQTTPHRSWTARSIVKITLPARPLALPDKNAESPPKIGTSSCPTPLPALGSDASSYLLCFCLFHSDQPEADLRENESHHQMAPSKHDIQWGRAERMDGWPRLDRPPLLPLPTVVPPERLLCTHLVRQDGPMGTKQSSLSPDLS